VNLAKAQHCLNWKLCAHSQCSTQIFKVLMKSLKDWKSEPGARKRSQPVIDLIVAMLDKAPYKWATIAEIKPSEFLRL
jgi:hypothetical protein